MAVNILVLCAEPGSHDWNETIETNLRITVEGITGILGRTKAEYTFVKLEAFPSDNVFRFVFGKNKDTSIPGECKRFIAKYPKESFDVIFLAGCMNYRPRNPKLLTAYQFARNLSFMQPIYIEQVRENLKPGGIIIAMLNAKTPIITMNKITYYNTPNDDPNDPEHKNYEQRAIDEVLEITHDSVGKTILGFECKSKILSDGIEHIYLHKPYNDAMDAINMARFIYLKNND